MFSKPHYYPKRPHNVDKILSTHTPHFYSSMYLLSLILIDILILFGKRSKQIIIILWGNVHLWRQWQHLDLCHKDLRILNSKYIFYISFIMRKKYIFSWHSLDLYGTHWWRCSTLRTGVFTMLHPHLPGSSPGIGDLRTCLPPALIKHRIKDCL